ncbi:Ankyrin repeat domain-containing protein [Tetrabaena socialis]|uniref:Ankyrin repeat domain-containing protein n=1 Tax=Tetrabaena socialis TaxID=47790 RepID=A0A2J7ZSQ6_9CHLO|nr:Ankyrin repeat domain-containing protein [Tetrabaena socialis]|eukprot:PNH03307.1 Ankyrin repeat domain-containing protein [Tetrabaena socialis]
MQRESQRPKREGPGGPSTPPETQQQQEGADPASPDPSRIWLPELVQRYAGSLHPNEVACALRLVNKATAAQFRGPQDTTVRLSLPVPYHAFVQRWGGVGALRSLTLHQRQQLSSLTACSGSIANLEVLLARDDAAACGPGDEALWAAAGAGQLEVCRWLRQQGCAWDRWTFYGAAKHGHQAVCEWLLASGCPWSDWAAGMAASGGHVGLMDWLLGTGHEPDVGKLLAGVAEGCDLPTLQRLHSTYFTRQPDERLKERMMAFAAGSLTADWRAKVEWLEGQGFPRRAEACKVAVEQPDGLGRLHWLQQRGYPLDVDVAWAAASVGAVDALQNMLESGVALDQRMVYDAARCAAEEGHLAVLQALHVRGFNIAGAAEAAAEHLSLPGVAWLVEALGAATVLSARVFSSAAKLGDMELLAWLVERLGAGEVLSARVFSAAAKSGSMELLAWLHGRGCPWDESVFAAAARTGSEEQLEWLAARGCPMGEDGEAYMWAVTNGDLAILGCLQRLGCPLGPKSGKVFARAIERSSLMWAAPCHLFRLQRGLLWLLGQDGSVVDCWDEAERVTQGLAHRREQEEELRTWVRAQRAQRM